MESIVLATLVAAFLLALLGLAAANYAPKKASHLQSQQGKNTEREEIADLTRALAVAESARTEAELVSRAKSDFLAVLSHELRTPLNSIIGFATIMENEMYGALGSRRYLEYARDISLGGEHVLGIVNDILDLSKIEAGQMKLEETVLDVEDVTRDALAMIQERAEERGIVLKDSLPAGLPRLVADRRLLKQMLLNLLSNAIDFTDDNGWVAVTAERPAGGGLTLAVSDTGVGIAKQDLPRVMDPFHAADGPFDRPVRGTGLGLPLVRSMIELHAGEITISSTEGVGTTVALRFPATRVVEAAANFAGRRQQGH